MRVRESVSYNFDTPLILLTPTWINWTYQTFADKVKIAGPGFITFF